MSSTSPLDLDEKNGGQERAHDRPRPRVQLIGTDGNAFAVLGAATRALREAGWTKEERDAFVSGATSGDYDRLLVMVMEYLDVE